MYSATILVFLLSLSSCEHRPLVELNELHYVRIYLDERLRNVNFGFYDETKEKPEYSTPNAMRVALFDPITGNMVTERYLRDRGVDEKGVYFHGLIPASDGKYNLMAYSFGTSALRVKDEKFYFGIKAYTSPVSDLIKDRLVSSRSGTYEDYIEEEDILYEPEHFFVTNTENVCIGLTDKVDTLRNHDGSDFMANSIVKTYYIQVNVKGVKYVNSAVALITGMAGSVTLHNKELDSGNPASIYFSMKNDVKKMRNNDDIAVVYATFNTFGKLQDREGFIYITFEFNTVWGNVQTETIRVTDMFETQEVKEKQWIIIDKLIEIQPDDEEFSGSTDPGVNQWGEIRGDITI